MEQLKDLIHKISSYPELYLGKKSLDRLHVFLDGYLYGNATANDHCLDGFTEFVAQKYRISTDHNWSSIINFFSNTEQEAFDEFIRRFEVFSSIDDKTPFLSLARWEISREPLNK